MTSQENHHHPEGSAAEWCIILTSGRLTPEEGVLFERWLNSDPANLDRFEKALAVSQAIGLNAAAVGEDLNLLRNEALADLTRVKRSAVNRGWLDRRLLLQSAAAVVLATVTGMWLSKSVVFQTTNIPQGPFRLADGSTLSLDADTLVKVKYSGSERQLWLEKGRAQFVVAKDMKRPFRVNVAGRMIIATGTRFSVEQIESQVHVGLFEGHLAVFRRSNDFSHSAHADYYLSAGEGLIFKDADSPALLIELEGNDALAWEKGQLIFTDEALDVAVARVNRYSARKIKLAAGLNHALKVSGVYKSGNTSAFLDGVSALSSLHYRSDSDGYILEPAGR